MAGEGHSPYFPVYYLQCLPSSFQDILLATAARMVTLILLTTPHAPLIVLSHPNMNVDRDKIIAVIMLIACAIY